MRQSSHLGKLGKVEGDDDEDKSSVMEVEEEEVVRAAKVRSFSTSMYLPYGVARSTNGCLYVVVGAHSFTS